MWFLQSVVETTNKLQVVMFMSDNGAEGSAYEALPHMGTKLVALSHSGTLGTVANNGI